MNAIEQGREQTKEDSAAPKKARRLDSVGVQRATPSTSSATQAAPQKETDAPTIPESVSKRHRQIGAEFYSRERDGALAFRDDGSKLSTTRNDVVTITSMVELAEAKGWKSITVTGDPAFKREAWRQAMEKGIEVKGYELTPNDSMIQIEAQRRRSEQANAKARETIVDGVRREQARTGNSNPRAAAETIVNAIAEKNGYAPSERAQIQAAVQRKIDLAAERGEIAGLKRVPKSKSKSKDQAEQVIATLQEKSLGATPKQTGIQTTPDKTTSKVAANETTKDKTIASGTTTKTTKAPTKNPTPGQTKAIDKAVTTPAPVAKSRTQRAPRELA
jgi:hypothetical protein